MGRLDNHSPINAVIFDFDGTLVDTMPMHYEAYRRVFAELGIELAPEEFFANVGGKWTDAIPKFLNGRSCLLSVDEIHNRKKVTVDRMFQTEAITQLDTAKLLPLLYGRVKIGLASSGARLGIDTALSRLGWCHYFDAVVAGEDVVYGKPNPEPFLFTAKLMGVKPDECIVFEDTNDGVQAGINAGMQVVDVRLTAGITSRLAPVGRG